MRWRARFAPLLVNTVVGFIGPEYLFDGKQIIRAGLEDHFCGKLMGLPMGVDVCYTNHAEADQDDMDTLADAARRRRRATSSWACRAPTTSCCSYRVDRRSTTRSTCAQLLGLRPAPEFEAWLQRHGMIDDAGRRRPIDARGIARLSAPGGAARR